MLFRSLQSVPCSGCLQGSGLSPSRWAQPSNSSHPKVCGSAGWMPCIRDHVIRLECEDEKLITIPPHCLLAPGLEQVPRKSKSGCQDLWLRIGGGVDLVRSYDPSVFFLPFQLAGVWETTMWRGKGRRGTLNVSCF